MFKKHEYKNKTMNLNSAFKKAEIPKKLSPNPKVTSNRKLPVSSRDNPFYSPSDMTENFSAFDSSSSNDSSNSMESPSDSSNDYSWSGGGGDFSGGGASGDW